MSYIIDKLEENRYLCTYGLCLANGYGRTPEEARKKCEEKVSKFSDDTKHKFSIAGDIIFNKND